MFLCSLDSALTPQQSHPLQEVSTPQCRMYTPYKGSLCIYAGVECNFRAHTQPLVIIISSSTRVECTCIAYCFRA